MNELKVLNVSLNLQNLLGSLVYKFPFCFGSSAEDINDTTSCGNIAYAATIAALIDNLSKCSIVGLKCKFKFNKQIFNNQHIRFLRKEDEVYVEDQNNSIVAKATFTHKSSQTYGTMVSLNSYCLEAPRKFDYSSKQLKVVSDKILTHNSPDHCDAYSGLYHSLSLAHVGSRYLITQREHFESDLRISALEINFLREPRSKKILYELTDVTSEDNQRYSNFYLADSEGSFAIGLATLLYESQMLQCTA